MIRVSRQLEHGEESLEQKWGRRVNAVSLQLGAKPPDNFLRVVEDWVIKPAILEDYHDYLGCCCLCAETASINLLKRSVITIMNLFFCFVFASGFELSMATESNVSLGENYCNQLWCFFDILCCLQNVQLNTNTCTSEAT